MPPAALLKCALKKAPPPPERNAEAKTNRLSLSLSYWRQHAAQERNAKHTHSTHHTARREAAEKFLSKGFLGRTTERRKERLLWMRRCTFFFLGAQSAHLMLAGWLHGGANWARMGMLSLYKHNAGKWRKPILWRHKITPLQPKSFCIIGDKHNLGFVLPPWNPKFGMDPY